MEMSNCHKYRVKMTISCQVSADLKKNNYRDIVFTTICILIKMISIMIEMTFGNKPSTSYDIAISLLSYLQ